MDFSQEYTIRTRSGEVSKRTLQDLLNRSSRSLLYFYPKDSTPGCTLEAQDFTRLRNDFEALGVQIIGISLDSSESHEAFATTCGLGIDLIADTDKSLHETFWVIGEKMNYGKKYVGVIRSTFLLDNTGNILREWRNVKATWHAEKIMKEIVL